MNSLATQFIALIITLVFSHQLLAGSRYTCEGKVSGVSINPRNGGLLVEKIGPLIWADLCSVEKKYNGITPETCKHIYSLLVTAQVSGKQATLWFNDGLDCSKASHKPWQRLTGWYFGPKLKD
jgi:hypothetical protein